MGGSAFLIRGRVDNKVLATVPTRRSLWDRLLRRPGYGGPKVTRVSKDRKLIDLPVDGLSDLKKDFRSFLADRISRPWESTKIFFRYVDEDVISVYLRGEQSAQGLSEWYVQFTFSGCAGTAEVSAELGAHWAEIWYLHRRDAIARLFLKPRGFAPDESRTNPTVSRAFLPVGALGYALYVGQEQAKDELFQPEYSFELDGAVMDMIETVRDQDPFGVLSGLEARFVDLMSDARCRCQLCMPELDVSVLGELP